MIKETMLFEPVRDIFVEMGYKICSEINYCDIAAMKDEKLVIIELKVNLSIELLMQGVKRQRICEDVFIAVPRTKTLMKQLGDITLLIKRLGLGLILVSLETNSAEIVVFPGLFDIIKSLNNGKRKKSKLISEFKGRSYDDNVGGSNKKKIMTAYKNKALFIACCLDIYGPLSPKKLIEHGADSRKVSSILTKNFYNWFYRVKKGLYDLTDYGKQALNEYNEVIKIHKASIIDK